MAFISSKKPSLFITKTSKKPTSLFFCTLTPPVQDFSETPQNPSFSDLPKPYERRSKGKNNEKLENIISRMMANRPWTTRLQNSIRNLVSENDHFDDNLLYNVLHSAKKPDQALSFFRWVERAGLIRPNKEAHLKIIEICANHSMINHARCILLDMPKKGIEWDEDMFVKLINSYGEKGIVQESVKIFDKMKILGVDRTLKSYDVLFKVIMRKGRYMMAKRYFNKMLDEGIVPTIYTYNTMIWGFFLSSKVDSAIRFFEEMKSKGISPDIVTYNTMINGYHRVKKVEEAEKYFVKMKGKNIAPNVISYTTMIKTYVSVGQVENALKMVEEMKSFDIRPNAITYSTILPGLCEAEKMSEASEILKAMVEKFIPPKDNSIFLSLILGQCKVGDLDAASYVLKAMNRLSVPIEAGHCGVLIENFCKAGAYDRAVSLLDNVIEKEIVLSPQSSLEMEASAYNPMITYLCNNGQTVKAETFFRQLMKKGVLDSVGFNDLVRGHSTEGNPELASEILKIMIRRSVPSDENAFEMLVKSYLKKGEPADAKIALDTMIEHGHSPDPALYRSVIESLFEDGRVQTSSRVMKTMVEKGVQENMDLVSKILEALLLRGHVEEALGRIDLLMQNGWAPDFDKILFLLCEKGKTIAALKLLDFGLERDCIIEFATYEKVLDTLLSAGKTLNAYSILCKIAEKGGDTGLSGCKDLIKTLNDEGNTKQADILSRMIKGDKVIGNKKGKKKAVAA